ncbi:MAG TPA: MBL fold metallo-hydrolase [Candidatus Paceibacterota bacterium]
MIITYHGGECFKVSQGDLTLAFNPPSKESKLKVSKFGSDIALVSLNNPDFNGVDTASLGDKVPFAILGPGEYDVKGVTVRGYQSVSEYDKKQPINTIYSVIAEGVHICFLGALGGDDLPHDAKQELDGIDILITPIGGEGVFDYANAYKRAVQTEAKVVIPMHYPSTGSGQAAGFGQKDALAHFLKEAAAESVKPIDKFVFKKKDLDGKEGEIVVLMQN